MNLKKAKKRCKKKTDKFKKKCAITFDPAKVSEIIH